MRYATAAACSGRRAVGIEEPGDGIGFDPRLAHLVGRHALTAATAQISDHLVLESEPDKLHAFRVQHLVECA